MDRVAATPDVPAVSSIGCADDQREAFISTLTHPNIAGCSGEFRCRVSWAGANPCVAAGRVMIQPTPMAVGAARTTCVRQAGISA